MKLSFAVLAASVATASAGVCCCSQPGADHSTSMQCGPSGDIPFALVVKQYSAINCNGKHATGDPVPVSNCTAPGVVGNEDACLAAAASFGSGACTWNSATSTAVTMAAAAAAVVAYVV